MKRTIILALLALLPLLTGCDAFRKLAGRPTAEELQQKRVEVMRAEEAAHQARIDSLKRVEKQMADSLAILDSLKQMKGTILNPAALGGLFTTKLDFKYYVVIGAFKTRSYAEKLLGQAQKAGYTATLINFRNGMNVIGVCQTNSLSEAFASLKKMHQESFCPPDAWILVNE